MNPRILRFPLRALFGISLPLLLAACITEGPSPPRVDLPEPGAGAPARSAPAVRPAQARTYPATSTGAHAYPSGSSVTASPGVPAGDAGDITVQSSSEPPPVQGYPAGAESSYPDAAGAAAPTEQGLASPSSAIAIEEGHVPARSSNNAVNALLASADGSRRRGDLDAAVAAAERALRIQPGDPAVYCELALLRLAQGQRELAVQLARKGLAQQPEPDLRARLEDVLARASAASG